MKRKKPLRSTKQLALANHGIFKDAARRQLVCQRGDCQAGGAQFHPHHVVYEQHLRARSLPRYDARNALRLCSGPLSCHNQHHGGNRKIKTCELRDENIDYAFDVLGDFALDYLRRYYDDADPDPRLLAREREMVA